MVNILISAVDIITKLIILLLIVHVVLAYFMSPFHPIRRRIDGIIEPLLNPIRRVVPTVGMIDFSPLILIVLVQILSLVIRNLLVTLL